MDSQRKIALGAALSGIAGTGIALSSILGWASADRPWGFILGFVFGIASGIGVALAVSGMVQYRKRG